MKLKQKRLSVKFNPVIRLSFKPMRAGIVCGFVLLILLFIVVGRTVFAPSKNLLNKPATSGSIDLIKGQDWSHFAGASLTAQGVKIQPLGRAIVNQDGSPNQINPSVNVRGPHLSVNGSFKLTVDMQQIPKTGTASLYLYGEVPIIYDEWRYQPPQLRIDLSQKEATVYEWDGTGDNAIWQKSWPAPMGANANVVLAAATNTSSFDLEINGHNIGSLPIHDIFSSGSVWFGADASIGSGGWLLGSLGVQVLNNSQLKVLPGANLSVKSSVSASTLRSLAAANARHLPIGAAVANYALFSDQTYRQLVASQFSMLTPENELKAQFVHPQPNVYSFTEADSLVDFALTNNMSVHGHALVFSEANPQWMQDAPLSQRQQIMVNHITTVVDHYGSKINEWDVVNEPLNDNDDNNGDSSDLRQNIWFAAMGENYIDIAFKAAHSANPSAKLYLNEYGLEADGPRWDEFLSLVKRLQAGGVPIDGIGFQAHVHESGDEVDTATLERHIQTLAAMGLRSRVSEIDVYGDDAQHQADQYAVALKACLAELSCTSFTIWGVTDHYGSTTDIHNYPLSYGNDLIWDSNLQPKAAYSSLQMVLKQY